MLGSRSAVKQHLPPPASSGSGAPPSWVRRQTKDPRPVIGTGISAAVLNSGRRCTDNSDELAPYLHHAPQRSRYHSRFGAWGFDFVKSREVERMAFAK